MDNIFLLPNRSILEISGEDRKKFLQGLITNDINKLENSKLLYSAMLNAQGRFLYDFFIFEIDNKIFLDCHNLRAAELLQKLNFYKLRSKVIIQKNDDLKPHFSLEKTKNLPENSFIFKDPRSADLGYRIYLNKIQHQSNQDLYTKIRIINKIAEGEEDLTYEKSFIQEFGFDQLNAIDYTKGCYVGQEPTARIHHLGEIRKKIFHIAIENLSQVEKNSEISCEGKSVGVVLSSLFYQNQLHALALIKISETITNPMLDNNKITIIS